MTARKPEQRAWDTFSKAIDGSRLKFWRVENLCGDGMPDVHAINRRGTSFWIENKAIVDWPAHSSTAVLARSFEPGQLPWGRSYRWFNGLSFVLLRVDSEKRGPGRYPRADAPPSFYLFNPVAPLEDMTKAQLQGAALVAGKDAILEYLYNVE
jgi:hypothetical protein